MILENIAGGVKLAFFIAKAYANLEAAMLDLIEDFECESTEQVSILKSGVCKNIECSDITLEPQDTGILISFVGLNKSIDKFAIDLTEFAYKIMSKVAPFIPGTDFENALNGLCVIHNEIDNSTFIEFPGREGTVSLEVTYNTEGDIGSIEIPISSERVLEKLKEMKENE